MLLLLPTAFSLRPASDRYTRQASYLLLASTFVQQLVFFSNPRSVPGQQFEVQPNRAQGTDTPARLSSAVEQDVCTANIATNSCLGRHGNKSLLSAFLLQLLGDERPPTLALNSIIPVGHSLVHCQRQQFLSSARSSAKSTVQLSTSRHQLTTTSPRPLAASISAWSSGLTGSRCPPIKFPFTSR